MKQQTIGSVRAAKPLPIRIAAGVPSLLAATLFALVLGGCATFVPQAGPGPEPAGRYRPLTTPIIAIGDTQQHLATGYPLHDNDSAVDTYVEVAQRPPEQPLFGRRIPEWALQHDPDEPFLHLGDVLDLSCRIEATRVAAMFRGTQNAGAILPGNHDGLMFGIYGYNVFAVKLDPAVQHWHQTCRRGAAPEDTSHKTANEALTKRDFITGYIAAQASGRRPKPGLTAPPPTGEHQVSWRSPDPHAYLSAIEAKVLDGSRYADSYLAQRLRLPPAPGATRGVIIIGLDTNQAGGLVGTWDVIRGRSPGDMGHVRPDQIEAIDPWVEEAIRQGDLVVFAGHHNWASLDLSTRTLMRAEMGKLHHPLVYLSAHTHSGFWVVHRSLARQPLLELNVSSLSDWPIAYRRISFAYDAGAQRLLVRADLMPHGDQPVKSYADLMAAWEAETCARTGLPALLIKEFDVAVVKQQRESRGSLMEWLLAAIPCETCEQTLYEHAQAYQDALLKTLLQGAAAAKQTGVKLPEWETPAACRGAKLTVCANALMAEQPHDYKSNVDLFRRKAALVAAANDSLDRLDFPKAKAYMTCRAVQAAKIDFDATPEARTENRSEAKRRAEGFFRIEASVGMD
jgi:hypothetical protein